MKFSFITLSLLGALCGAVIAKPQSSGGQPATAEYRPYIPQTWDDMRTFELPLVDPSHSPEHVTWEYYYRVPWRPIYKSYPVYAPGREPAGYFDWLKQQPPEVVWGVDESGTVHKPMLRSEAEWVAAGEFVFDSPIAYDSDPWGAAAVSLEDVRDPAWYGATGTPVAANGTMPFARYIVRKKGVVEVGQQACGMCHTRVMADGAVVKGAQGNFPFDRALAYRLQRLAAVAEKRESLLLRVRWFLRASFAAPWIADDPDARLSSMSLEEIAGVVGSIPPGVVARTGSSPFHPAQVPDLIGLKDRIFLDHTGLALQRTAKDLMRYAALNQDMKGLARYGRFVPEGINFETLPDPATRSRYLDEQLYALVQFLYSVRPPQNPHRFDAAAERGRQVFEREECGRCHTPPLYTHNKLAPVDGFAPTDERLKDYEMIRTSVGTDPGLALATRRGTGFYKVPSLKGLWYRGMFPHDGACATLEDWFDPRRLRDDYVPTGFRGYGVITRAVKGHAFGLSLSPEDKKSLIAFLETL